MRYAAVALIGAFALVACRPGGLADSSVVPVSSSQPLESHVYVWQAAALEHPEALPGMSLWWFAGQVETTPSGPVVEVSPSPSHREGVQVAGLVYRLRTPVIDWLQSATDVQIREALAAPLAEITETLDANSSRLQLDFDCPTGKLQHYSRLLMQVRAALPAVELSITALPDWLGNPDFVSITKQIDFYVLQVHGLTLPTTLEVPAPIFDPARAARYVQEATTIGVPFHVALPTYGHRQWFQPDGAFVGISAELPVNLSPSAHNVREERADPAEVAAFVRAIQGRHSTSLRGLFWFRMPAVGDELNWCMDTFRHVAAGEVPPETLRVELRETEPGLVSVYLHNAPDHDYRGRAEVRLTHTPGARVLGEGLRGFTLEQRGGEVIFRGRGPEPGDSMEIGWIRSSDREALSTKSINLQVRSLQ